MMKDAAKLKFLTTLILLFLYCILQLKLTDMTLISLYRGISVGGQIYYFLLMYFQFAIFSFYIYGVSTVHIESYGLLLITRYQNRNIMVKMLLCKLIKTVFVIELMKLIIYLMLIILMARQVSLGNLYGLCGFFIGNILCLYFFLICQIVVEINSSPQIALISTQSFYLITLFISDFMLQFNHTSIVNLLIIVNYQMVEHYYQLEGDFIKKSICLVVSFIILFLVLYKVGTYLFSRKDIVS